MRNRTSVKTFCPSLKFPEKLHPLFREEIRNNCDQVLRILKFEKEKNHALSLLDAGASLTDTQQRKISEIVSKTVNC